MDPKYYEFLLEQHIGLLEAEMQAVSPQGWPVPSLAESFAQGAAQEAVRDVWAESFAQGAAQEAVRDVWDYALYELQLVQQKALADQSYGEKKVQHLYL